MLVYKEFVLWYISILIKYIIMKIKYLVFLLSLLSLACKKSESKEPTEKLNTIETDYFIIKSKYDLKINKESIPNSLLKGVSSKDSLKYLYVTNDDLVIGIYDEKFINDNEKFQEIEKKHSLIFNIETPTIYHDTIINSYKIRVSELKIEKDLIYYHARILDNKACYVLSLTTKEKKILEDKKVFFEILEGTSIK